MGLAFAENPRPHCRSWNLPFYAAQLFAVWFAGCHNTCFTFTSNPPTGTVNVKLSDLSQTCKLTTANGAVRVQMGAEAGCGSCGASGQVQHIFLSIRGIEVHPNATADEDSPDWQELLRPESVKQPLQVDLAGGVGDRGERKPLGEIANVPAGIYRQLRVRLVPNQLATDAPVPEENKCGGAGFNCVVMTDGRIQPLLLDTASPELRIASESMEGAFLLISPDTDTELVIEFKLVWALFSSANGRVRFLPALTGSAKVRRVELDWLGTVEEELPSRGRMDGSRN